jgi:TolB-like protein/DNA-binding winged helix-turn-helix (wHTH) protein/Flp pilus assembly protein TadD
MSDPSARPAGTRVRFGVFDFDLRTGELRKAGARVRLSGQPVTVLARLVQRPGELVTREELRRELWPDTTFVDFEHNLNSAIKRLRAALGDSAATPRYVETLPRRGYRFVAPVAVVAPVDARHGSSPAVAGAADPQPLAEPARPSLRPGGAQLALLALLGCLTIALIGVAATRQPARGYYALAVLPFALADADSTDDEYLAFGLAEALTTELAALKGPRVISQTSSMRYRATDKKLPQIARELGVDAVVEGSVQREGDLVRITVQLIESATDTHLWAKSYERNVGSVLAVADEVARAVADEIRIRVLRVETSRGRGGRAADPEAARAYLRGRYYLGKGTDADFALAAAQFERALAVDDTHAPSHSGLADYYILTDGLAPEAAFPKARLHARRAIELDDSLPDAHASLAFVHFYHDWDWASAEREFRKAIALSPDHARARRWYAMFLSAMRRHAEAIEQIAHALEVDPLAIANHDAAAMIRFQARQFQEAAEIGRGIAALDRFDVRGYEQQGLALIQLEQYAAAHRIADEGLALSPSYVVLDMLRVLSLGRLGQRAEAERAHSNAAPRSGSSAAAFRAG